MPPRAAVVAEFNFQNLDACANALSSQRRSSAEISRCYDTSAALRAPAKLRHTQSLGTLYEVVYQEVVMQSWSADALKDARAYQPATVSQALPPSESTQVPDHRPSGFNYEQMPRPLSAEVRETDGGYYFVNSQNPSSEIPPSSQAQPREDTPRRWRTPVWLRDATSMFSKRTAKSAANEAQRAGRSPSRPTTPSGNSPNDTPQQTPETPFRQLQRKISRASINLISGLGKRKYSEDDPQDDPCNASASRNSVGNAPSQPTTPRSRKRLHLPSLSSLRSSFSDKPAAAHQDGDIFRHSLFSRKSPAPQTSSEAGPSTHATPRNRQFSHSSSVYSTPEPEYTSRSVRFTYPFRRDSASNAPLSPADHRDAAASPVIDAASPRFAPLDLDMASISGGFEDLLRQWQPTGTANTDGEGLYISKAPSAKDAVIF